MKKILLVLFLSSIGIDSFAQQEEKYNISGDDLPEWVSLMYQENPDVGEVVEAYEDYYKEHRFEKNTYTQYYKRWIRRIGREGIGKKKQATIQNKAPKMSVPGAEWNCIGPFDFDKDAASTSYAAGAAHVYTVEQSISNPDVLYAGTATAGLWKSIDKGLNWTLITVDYPINEIHSIAIDHGDEATVYFEGDEKIYKSTDGGSNWVLSGSNYNVNDMVMDPLDANIIFLCSDEGLQKTANGGDSWEQLLPGKWLELEYHPIDASIVYAVRQIDDKTTFYKSSDGGESFVLKENNGWPLPSGNDEQKRTEIAVSLAAPDNVYALATGEANGGSGLYGMYVSTDAGENWTFRCCGEQPGGAATEDNMNLMGWSDEGLDDGGQFYYDLALEVSDTDPNKIHVGAVNHWISDDGGYTFSCPAKWSHSEKDEYVHADIHDIRYYGDDLWIACDGGIFYSDNGGDLIQKRQYGIAGTDFWGFGAGFWDGEVMVGGTYHNGTLLKDNDVYENGWLSTQGGDNIRGHVNYANERKVYHDGRGRLLSGDRNVEINSFPFALLHNASYIVGESSNLAFHPQTYETIYTGEGNQLWKSIDGGKSFSEIHDFNQKVTRIQISWSNPEVMYVASYEGWWDTKKLWRTTNGGNDWTDITPSGGVLGGQEWVPYDIAVSDTDPDVLWIARTSQYGDYPDIDGNQVFKSTNGGDTWESIATPILNGEQLTNIKLQRGTLGGVWIGTRNSVYYRNASMTDWEEHSNGLPAQTNSTALVPYYREGKMRNATNHSVYEAEFYESSSPKAQIAANTLETYCVRDTVYFTDHSAVSESNLTWNWSFPGGTPSSSNMRQPKVVYASPGNYQVSLTVSNDEGTDTQNIDNFISVTNECDPEGNAGNAIHFTGDESSFAVADANATPKFGSTQDFTVAMWIKTTTSSSDAAIATDKNWWSGYNTGWVFSVADGQIWMNVGDGDNRVDLYSGVNVNDGKWHHVSGVFDRNGMAKLYVDGWERASESMVDVLDINSSLPLTLGTDVNYNYHYEGTIDELKIWDTALSENVLREKMHLTADLLSDEDLLLYYQFNRNGGNITDRVAVNHASPSGTATRIVSTAPVGKGVSHTATINSSVGVTFTNTDLAMDFGLGSFPNGDVVVSKLETSPDSSPSVFWPMSDAYWLVHNYGENTNVDALSELYFSNIGSLSNEAENSDVKLYRRDFNAEGNTWGSAIDEADELTVGTIATAKFLNVVDAQSWGQFVVLKEVIGLHVDESILEENDEDYFSVYPNPIRKGDAINIKTNAVGELQFILYDVLGKKKLETSFETAIKLPTMKLKAGNYFYRIKSNDEMQFGTLSID